MNYVNKCLQCAGTFVLVWGGCWYKCVRILIVCLGNKYNYLYYALLLLYISCIQKWSTLFTDYSNHYLCYLCLFPHFYIEPQWIMLSSYSWWRFRHTPFQHQFFHQCWLPSINVPLPSHSTSCLCDRHFLPPFSTPLFSRVTALLHQSHIVSFP